MVDVALFGAGRIGQIHASIHRPTEVTFAGNDAIHRDTPVAFFLERYRATYAAESAHFFAALRTAAPVRRTIDDAVKAHELVGAAARSWKEGRIVSLQPG